MSVKTKILIADDEDEWRHVFRRYFEMKGHEVFESATVKETIELIKKERFDIVVLDTCDMEGEGRGIEKVLEFIESESPTTQVIIHSASATKYEPRFKNFKVAQAWIDKSPDSIEKIILSLTTKTHLSPLKIKIDNIELTITDPFDIPSTTLVGMLDFEIYDKLYTTVYERYGEQINQKIIETGAKTLVVYKDNGEVKVAGKSNSPYYPSDEELEKIQQKVGKVCYVVGMDIIEENQCIEKSNWTSIPEIPENPYPTIPIYLGRLDEEYKNIIREDRLIISDFDTGNHNILALKMNTVKTCKFHLDKDEKN